MDDSSTHEADAYVDYGLMFSLTPNYRNEEQRRRFRPLFWDANDPDEPGTLFCEALSPAARGAFDSKLKAELGKDADELGYVVKITGVPAEDDAPEGFELEIGYFVPDEEEVSDAQFERLEEATGRAEKVIIEALHAAVKKYLRDAGCAESLHWTMKLEGYGGGDWSVS